MTGWSLLVGGALLVLLGLGLAFTFYGEIALVLGGACIVVGAAILGRRRRSVPLKPPAPPGA
ncbi:MAG: hypothetical protein ACRDYC_03260 [Acidimicrobiales bacterium]